MKEKHMSIIVFLLLFNMSSFFISLFTVMTLSNIIVIFLVAGGITWIFNEGRKLENIKMECNIGLASEFKDCFTETQQFRIYEGKQRSSIFGVSRFHTSEAWIFIDRIASYDKSYDYNIIEEITRTVVHELIHLCGVYDESAAHFGERLVK